jgi:hypothetical protein
LSSVEGTGNCSAHDRAAPSGLCTCVERRHRGQKRDYRAPSRYTDQQNTKQFQHSMKPTSATQSRVSGKTRGVDGETRELIGMQLSSARLNTAQPVRKSDGLQLLREVTWKKITFEPTSLLRTASGSYLLRPETLLLTLFRKLQVTPSKSHAKLRRVIPTLA